MFLFLCKLVVGATYAEEVDEDLFDSEEAEKNDVSLVVCLNIALVQKMRGHKDMVVVILMNSSGTEIERHYRNANIVIFETVLDFLVLIPNVRLQVDCVNQDGVQDETESIADPENFSCSLDDVTSLRAAVPDNEDKEL